jgi:hypothetical protein
LLWRGVLCLACLLCCPGAAPAGEDAGTRYLRAVHVLKKLDPSLSAGPVAIPGSVITDDAANSLVSHPDKIFVLTTLGRELDALAEQGVSDAAYYAAHAYGKLGRRSDAARAMFRYLSTAPYRAEDYLFLVRCLYGNREYEAMRAVAVTWRRNDPRCSETRLTYVWGSHMAEGDAEGSRDALRSGSCSGWRPGVLEARSILSLRGLEEAEKAIAALVRRNPKRADLIRVFWEQIRDLERYP